MSPTGHLPELCLQWEALFCWSKAKANWVHEYGGGARIKSSTPLVVWATIMALKTWVADSADERKHT